MSHDDNWKFYEDNGGKWRWTRTASNGEIVGASSQGFSSEESAVNNARLMGYEGEYSDNATFELYQDDSGEHRWRATASNGEIVGCASEGYSSKDSCVANAERHGYQA